MDEKIESVDREIKYFNCMVDGSDKIISKTVSGWKLALILTNAFWALVLALLIWFAYMSPSEFEATQDQNIPAQSQGQTVRGAN